ncbi:MAG: LOG family protein, partial [Candidatus Babeliales bacterium]
CVQKFFIMRNFPARIWLLTRYSMAYVVMPGGFGTLDELAEVATLIQTKRIENRPIVLIGKEYWLPFFDWVMKSALPKGLVSKEDVRLLELTDDLNEAVCLIRGRCELLISPELT